MITIEERHLKIVKAILSAYDHSFYAFGSRTTGKARRFSDLDLFFMETIPNQSIIALEAAFEESDLPYKVDLVNFHNCDPAFQKIMESHAEAIQVSSALQSLEAASLGHFQYLPQKLGMDCSSIDSIALIDSKLNTSMFNIAYGCPAGDAGSWQSTIEKTIAHFSGKPFAWWIPASQRSHQFNTLLINSGFRQETTEQAMLIDLNNFIPQDIALNVKQVQSISALKDFISIIAPYDEAAKSFYQQLQLSDLNDQEKLFVGYEETTPVTIAILFESGETSAIFSLITESSKQRRGYGTAMMRFLLHFAKNHHSKQAILLASNKSAYQIYQRLGFKKVGLFDCFEYPTL